MLLIHLRGQGVHVVLRVHGAGVATVRYCFLMINEAVLKLSITLLPFSLISQWQLMQCINHGCWIVKRLKGLQNIFTDGIHSKPLEIIKNF